MPAFSVSRAADLDPRQSVRPLRAGAGIFNPAAGTPGTLGLLLTADGADRWILSCYHVLCRPYRFGVVQPFSFGEAIFQPDDADGSAPVALLQSGEVRTLTDRLLDAAAARVLDGVATVPGVLGLSGIASASPPLAPHRFMKVVKSGRSTGVTHGIIDNVRTVDGVTRVEVAFDFDENDARFVAAGDSGAVWFDRQSGLPVAMHQGETNTGASSAVALTSLLRLLNLAPA